MYHGLHISRVHTYQVFQTISFCNMEANICAGPLWSLPRVTLLTPGMLIWSLDLWKMRGPLRYIQGVPGEMCQTSGKCSLC